MYVVHGIVCGGGRTYGDGLYVVVMRWGGVCGTPRRSTSPPPSRTRARYDTASGTSRPFLLTWSVRCRGGGAEIPTRSGLSVDCLFVLKRVRHGAPRQGDCMRWGRVVEPWSKHLRGKSRHHPLFLSVALPIRSPACLSLVPETGAPGLLRFLTAKKLRPTKVGAGRRVW